MKDWPDAIRRWESVLEHFDAVVPPRAYARLAAAYAEHGEPGLADAVIERGRLRFPDRVGLAVQWAQLPMVQRNWAEAIRRCELVLDRFESETPAKTYLRLAEAYSKHGDPEEAAAVIERGRSRFPDEVGLAVQWAQQAMVQEDWPDAIRRWEEILEHFDAVVPPRAYAGLARAYVEHGEPGLAAAVIDRGRSRFPDEVGLAVRWAHLATLSRDLAEGIRRGELVLDRFESVAPPRVYVRLAGAYSEQGDPEKAAAVIERGRSRFPHEVSLAAQWAQLAMVQEDWPEAIRRWEAVVDQFESVAPAKSFARLAVAYTEQGEFDAAAAVIERGRARFRDDVGLAIQWAHLAMVEEQWPEAIRRWQDVIRRQEPNRSEMPHVHRLPIRAANLDWYEAAWVALAQVWPSDPNSLGFETSVCLYVAVAQVLEEAGALAEAGHVLNVGYTIYPRDRRLAFGLLANRIAHSKERPGSASHVGRLETSRTDQLMLNQLEVLPGLGLQPDPTSSSKRDGGADFIAEVDRAENAATLAGFITQPVKNELPAIHLIRVPRESSIELEVRTARHYTQQTVRERIQELSERDGWPEISDQPSPLPELARQLSRVYGRRFEELPFLSAQALSDAVYFVIYAELCVYEPIRRLAAVIASENGAEPVFVEISRGSISYLNGYFQTSFGQVYLYFELRRLGVNAFLCEFTDPALDADRSEIIFPPSSTLMKVPPPAPGPVKSVGHAAVIPAGIRGLDRVVALIENPVLYTSGYYIQEFAYDRLARKRTLDAEATIHPPQSLLREVRFQLWPAGKLVGTQLSTEVPVSVEAPIQVSARVGMDWIDWLNYVLHDYLADMSRRAHAEVAIRKIREAHICDHLFPESSLFAAAVRKAGGRIVLWPHSTNPVHSDVRRAGSFDGVHATTRTAYDDWRSRFPDVEVNLTPSLMLPPPRVDVLIDDDLPLSVVVLGGKQVIGSMPFVDQTRHEESHRQFFAGLANLQHRLPINVFYKPKGMRGENESWLQKVVGRLANWQRVVEHPLRLSLPNMLFVSVSVGSSGLLEGLGRGIPCLIVRDFPTRDYTLVSAGIPSGTSEEMLEIVRKCATPGGLKDLVLKQLEFYLYETGYSPPAPSG